MRAAGALACLWLMGACQNEKGQAPASSVSAAPSAVVASSAEPPGPKPVSSEAARTAGAQGWAQGNWAGHYAAERAHVSESIGPAREWARDDGRKGAGNGEVKLNVGADGAVTGTAQGPLGAQAVRGLPEEDGLRLEFSPAEPGPDAFNGVVFLAREGAELKGHLQASSGDSLTVRAANIVLAKSQP